MEDVLRIFFSTGDTKIINKSLKSQTAFKINSQNNDM